MGIAVAKNSSVHIGSSSKNGSHAVFHCPSARIASQAGVAADVCRAGVTPAALASSRRIGAPRLHEWMDIREAALRTNKISSRVAPASRAARIAVRRLPKPCSPSGRSPFHHLLEIKCLLSLTKVLRFDLSTRPQLVFVTSATCCGGTMQ